MSDVFLSYCSVCEELGDACICPEEGTCKLCGGGLDVYEVGGGDPDVCFECYCKREEEREEQRED